MDQKQKNRFILSCFVVPIILFVLYLVIGRLTWLAFTLFHDFTQPVHEFNLRLAFYARYAILAGAGTWIVLYAYVFVRYGEFSLNHLNIFRKQ